MNKKETIFLNSKLTELVDNGIITDIQFIAAKEHFGTKKESKSLSTVFGAIGIFLIALSIITLFAMNWNNIAKGLKVIISFVPLAITAYMLHEYMYKGNKKLQLYTSIFAPVSIIATNSLIAQIFHIQTEIYELFFTSLLMFLPIAFILFNKLSVLVYSMGTVIYSLVAINSYTAESEALLKTFILALPIIIANFINYIKDKNDDKNILMWITNVILATLFISHKEWINPESILMYLYMLYFLTQTLFDKTNPLNKVLSFAFMFYLLLSCTTAEMLEFTEELVIHVDTLLFAALAGVFIYLSEAYKNPKEYFIFAFIALAQFTGLQAEFLFVLVNLIAISLGIYKIVIGNQKNSYPEIKQGVSLVLLIIMFRFISAELSFGIKSILFLIAGTCFLLSGKVIKKKIGGNKND
ncbi:MAG: DUF2157 domain-containing protein [Clostridia bacterium]|nr:DUF2157 domain-containing protein [Clostridia bacterium]